MACSPEYTAKVVEAVGKLIILCHEYKFNILTIDTDEDEPEVDLWYRGNRISQNKPDRDDCDWTFLDCCEAAIAEAEKIKSSLHTQPRK